MNVPADLLYSADHEWVRDLAGGRIRIGITDYAQDALGDVVFVEVPVVGTSVAAGSVFGEVESTKSVSELYAPVDGEVVAVNEDLEATEIPATVHNGEIGAVPTRHDGGMGAVAARGTPESPPKRSQRARG